MWKWTAISTKIVLQPKNSAWHFRILAFKYASCTILTKSLKRIRNASRKMGSLTYPQHSKVNQKKTWRQKTSTQFLTGRTLRDYFQTRRFPATPDVRRRWCSSAHVTFDVSNFASIYHRLFPTSRLYYFCHIFQWAGFGNTACSVVRRIDEKLRAIEAIRRSNTTNDPCRLRSST